MSSTSAGAPTASRVRGRPAGPPPLRARLCIVYPPGATGAIDLSAERLLLGRAPAGPGARRLDHSTVSRRHCAVVWDARLGAHLVSDLGSRNGSWLDGAGVDATPRPLASGAVLRLGDVLLVYESGELDAPDAPEVSHEAIPGQAAATRLLRAQLARAAPDHAPVLLLGETGTGKEFAAAELHRLSGRPGPLLAFNCAALSPHLVESQLFGHQRGAFTGATESLPGLFRSAQGGTLVLDEIGELALELQPKLLRAVQEGEVHPLGSPRGLRVDVRVVAATHRDLGALAESGGFRRDLYARLSLWEVRLPPLRERRVDLLAWIERLDRRRRELRGRAGTSRLRFEPEAAEALLLAPWPENLRGLDRLVHEIASDEPGWECSLSDLPTWAKARLPGPAQSESAPRPQVPTREELVRVLMQMNGSVRATARHFRRDRRQIYRWMEAYSIAGIGRGRPRP